MANNVLLASCYRGQLTGGLPGLDVGLNGLFMTI